ncbi:Uu.00g119810.m01.CDS01 [Anthostomella pinea]|uniref:Uu.00g119810.m01.CDS01 n=1 Tax=Anthostomella pinea TaxID=933095 RepID=A0AAI8VGQ7_9PEZI|nr:Uu.00g119810.m01.CDS01 [Anthostomella pinea]
MLMYLLDNTQDQPLPPSLHDTISLASDEEFIERNKGMQRDLFYNTLSRRHTKKTKKQKKQKQQKQALDPISGNTVKKSCVTVASETVTTKTTTTLVVKPSAAAAVEPCAAVVEPCAAVVELVAVFSAPAELVSAPDHIFVGRRPYENISTLSSVHGTKDDKITLLACARTVRQMDQNKSYHESKHTKNKSVEALPPLLQQKAEPFFGREHKGGRQEVQQMPKAHPEGAHLFT